MSTRGGVRWRGIRGPQPPIRSDRHEHPAEHHGKSDHPDDQTHNSDLHGNTNDKNCSARKRHDDAQYDSPAARPNPVTTPGGAHEISVAAVKIPLPLVREFLLFLGERHASYPSDSACRHRQSTLLSVGRLEKWPRVPVSSTSCNTVLTSFSPPGGSSCAGSVLILPRCSLTPNASCAAASDFVRCSATTAGKQCAPRHLSCYRMPQHHTYYRLFLPPLPKKCSTRPPLCTMTLSITRTPDEGGCRHTACLRNSTPKHPGWVRVLSLDSPQQFCSVIYFWGGVTSFSTKVSIPSRIGSRDALCAQSLCACAPRLPPGKCSTSLRNKRGTLPTRVNNGCVPNESSSTRPRNTACSRH